MTTPRVFIARHGETEWSLSGQHTSFTDLPLTANGERRVSATGRAMVGMDRLIDPRHILKVFISPRLRARRTFDLLVGADKCGVDRVAVDDRVQEWNYGDYEGLLTAQIRKLRKERGLDPGDKVWNIWQDGCENGESPEQITRRLDDIIAEVQELQRAHQKDMRKDILIVGHGHILRALAMRWVRKSIHENPALLLEAGAIGVLSYEHNNIDEPAILLGGAFIVPDPNEKDEE
ncbi:histidine phosphatase superfamily [Lipomyces tetrasporus]|uniref:Histidine phosphatase superfamily n=1 Tax=Lipomyces tetrasporus TaxID=54092 RepID=A0AAD7QT14_9ASCO|nr:histidine phosphatase superfamily [Lipomyces tetrasporus]KAJ8100461.1 histidine phosphatase superfamily [Lipomyces tetrasporus]